MAPSNSPEPCSVAQLLAYFLRLGTLGVGGPIASSIFTAAFLFWSWVGTERNRAGYLNVVGSAAMVPVRLAAMR
jgi:hypothetical protein